MSDEPTAPAEEEQDTPTSTDDAPDESGQAPEAAPEVDSIEEYDFSQVPEDAGRDWFEEQDKLRRADYTRKMQALGEQRKQVAADQETVQQAQQAKAILDAARDPNNPNHKEAIAFLGLEIDDEDFEDDDSSELEQRLARLEQDRQLEAQRQAEATQAQQHETVVLDRFNEARQKVGRDFDEPELRFLLAYAESNPDGEGLPDVDAAVEQLKLIYGGEQKRWLGSKKAPRTPGAGTPASRDVNYNDQDARLAEATRVAEAAMQS